MDVPVVVLSAPDITSEERIRLSEADRVLRKGDASLRDIAAEMGRLDKSRNGNPASGGRRDG